MNGAAFSPREASPTMGHLDIMAFHVVFHGKIACAHATIHAAWSNQVFFRHFLRRNGLEFPLGQLFQAIITEPVMATDDPSTYRAFPLSGFFLQENSHPLLFNHYQVFHHHPNILLGLFFRPDHHLNSHLLDHMDLDYQRYPQTH